MIKGNLGKLENVICEIKINNNIFDTHVVGGDPTDTIYIYRQCRNDIKSKYSLQKGEYNKLYNLVRRGFN